MRGGRRKASQLAQFEPDPARRRLVSFDDRFSALVVNLDRLPEVPVNHSFSGIAVRGAFSTPT